MTANDLISEIKERLIAEIMPVAKKSADIQYADRIKKATLSADEAAEYIGISKTLLYTMAKEKRIPWFPVGVAGSQKPQMRFRLSALDSWMDDQEKMNYQNS
ncbi:helix-turn-helix domain-containing protein [Paenibacillus sp. FSL L8-0333]|uniref:helix-turn-helix domain-containing protein n=1 Tax=Paenibacillus sp. FSL L8-0333 TaxID=2975331 RepID=UPI0030CC348D